MKAPGAGCFSNSLSESGRVFLVNSFVEYSRASDAIASYRVLDMLPKVYQQNRNRIFHQFSEKSRLRLTRLGSIAFQSFNAINCGVVPATATFPFSGVGRMQTRLGSHLQRQDSFGITYEVKERIAFTKPVKSDRSILPSGSTVSSPAYSHVLVIVSSPS